MQAESIRSAKGVAVGGKKSRNRYTNGVRSASSKSYKETSVMEYECKRIDM